VKDKEGDTMKCFYHTDMDGKCAGAIVKKWWDKQEDSFPNAKDRKSEYIAINYNDDFPFDLITPNEQVIIVDFSLQKDGEFEKLEEITKNITWIDYHKTAIEKHPAMSKLKGIRNIDESGCELTWNYYFSNEEMPIIVEMLGRYDVWDFSKHGEKLNELQAGVRLFSTNPEAINWVTWLNTQRDNIELDGMGYVNDGLTELLGKGCIALKFRDNQYASLIKAWSFFTEFEGYKVIACNAGSVSSQLFDSVKEDYDLMMPFVWDGKQWTVSIYSTKDIDCSELAKKYGGGGHKGASGFQCEKLPF